MAPVSLLCPRPKKATLGGSSPDHVVIGQPKQEMQMAIVISSACQRAPTINKPRSWGNWDPGTISR